MTPFIFVQITTIYMGTQVTTLACVIFEPLLGASNSMEKLKLYAPILSKVAGVLISNMAKPQEVTIKENEEGWASAIFCNAITFVRLSQGAGWYVSGECPLIF